MPTTLGQLSTSQPAPNGRVQFKRGAVDNSGTLSQANAPWTLLDGNGQPMQITYTPTYACYWAIHANVMSHGVTDGVGWRRWDYAIDISPADANGISRGFQCPNQVYDNATVEWRTSGASCMFKLNAGVTYTCSLVFVYCSGGSIRYHTGPSWLRLVGRVVGEGAI